MIPYAILIWERSGNAHRTTRKELDRTQSRSNGEDRNTAPSSPRALRREGAILEVLRQSQLFPFARMGWSPARSPARTATNCAGD